MKFLANENYPYPSIKILREAGYDVKSIGEEMYGITDVEVLDIAQKESRIILTFDKDYGELIFLHKSFNPPAVVFYWYKGAGPNYAGEILLELIGNNIVLDDNFTVIEQNNLRQRKYQ